MSSSSQHRPSGPNGLLVGKNVYIHCDTGSSYPYKIEILINKLKANLVEFFNKNIDIIITTRPANKIPQKPDLDCSQKVCPSEKVNENLNKSVMSRGQAMLMAANRSSSSIKPRESLNKSGIAQDSKDLLAKAKMIGIKIVTVEMFLNWVENLPIEYRSRLNVDNELSEDFDEDLRDEEKDRLAGVRFLQNPCIKIVDNDKKSRPLYIEQTNYLPYIFPNCTVINKNKSQSKENVDPKKKVKKAENTLQKSKSEPKVKQTPSKNKKRNSTKKKNDDVIEEPSGFCECCSTQFKNLLAHLQSKDHQEFASNKENFRVLDDVLNKVKTFEEFSKLFTDEPSESVVPSSISLNDSNTKNSKLLCSCGRDTHPYPMVSIKNKESVPKTSNNPNFLSPEIPSYHKTCPNCDKAHIPSNISLEQELKANIFLGVNFNVDQLAKNCHETPNPDNSSMAESPPLLSDQVYELSDTQPQSVSQWRVSENLAPPTLSSPTSFAKSKFLEPSIGENSRYHGNLISFMNKSTESMKNKSTNQSRNSELPEEIKPLQVSVNEEDDKENFEISNVRVYLKRNAARVARESISLSVKALYSPGGLDRLGFCKPSHKKPILVEESVQPISILCSSIQQVDIFQDPNNNGQNGFENMESSNHGNSLKQLSSINISFKEPSNRDPLGILDQNSLQNATQNNPQTTNNPSSIFMASYNSVSRVSSIQELERSRSSFILNHKSGDLWQLADVVSQDVNGNDRPIPKLVLRRKRPNFEAEDIESPNLSYNFDQKPLDISVQPFKTPCRISDPRKELFCSTPMAKRHRR